MIEKQKGFTLIELMVTISLIAVLTAIAIVYYGNTQKKARDNKRKSDLEQVRAALEMYRSQNGTYPNNDDGNGSNWATMTSTLQSNEYLNQPPQDPRSGTYNYYYYSDSGADYTLCAYLEGEDPNQCGTNSCGGKDCNYAVTNP